MVDRIEKEEGAVLFISIIMQGMIHRSFGHWVHCSHHRIFLDIGSIYLLQLLTRLESPNKDSKSPNRD